ncbi:ABC transporter permease [Promicromonospora vindobonensis]|uniref:ABC transporter permease n=1 Tax=Promicromonospora vindobonensis TaxID=195748 RepID=A0ABW5VR31_9MICO
MTAVAVAPAALRPASGSTLTGTGRLVRFMLRRDRVRLSVWTLSVVAFYAYFAVALDAMGPQALAARALVMQTPAGIVMGGPGYGIEDYTVGVAIANEGITWVVLALGIMSVLHVVRHTRAEEESSRSELVRAAPVGRHAPAVAAIVTLLVVNAVIAVVSALALTGASGGELPLADSFGLTVGSGLAAMVFGAVAVVACQVTEHGRGATGIGLAAYGLALVLRSAGDIQEPHGSLLSWLSPIGWAQQMRAFVDLRWWPTALSVVAILLLLALAAFLASRRDFGGGLVATRGGRAEASPSLRSPLALAWRQQRSAFLWTALGMAVMWYASGTLLPEILEMGASGAADNELFEAVFGGTDPAVFRDGFLGAMMLFAALTCAAYAIVLSGRAKAEEAAGRAEVVLALSVSRSRWFGAHLLVVGLSTVALVAVSVYAMWAGAAQVGMGEPGLGAYTDVFWTYSVALLVYLGLAAVLYAWVPRLASAAWLLLVYSFVVGMFGAVFDLPEGAEAVSPLDWLPAGFGEAPEAANMAGLAGVTVVLLVLAFLGFRRRDLQSN